MKDDVTLMHEEDSEHTKKVECFERMDPLIRSYANGINDSLDAEESDAEHAQTVLGDMLTDLMHWADLAGVDFDGALSSAAVHYASESDEDDGTDEDDEDDETEPGSSPDQ